MFTVLPFTRIVFGLLSVIIFIIIQFVINEPVIIVIYTVFVLWFQFYLRGMKIEIASRKIIKTGGSILKRKTIYMIKNTDSISTYILLYKLPALVRVSFVNRNVYIIGLNGYQAAMLENRLENTDLN